MSTDRERLGRLDEEIADVGGRWEPDPPHSVHHRDVFAHPEGGGLYNSLDCPNGSKVALHREYPAGGVPGPVWLRILPIGPRAEHLTTRFLVGTADEVHDWYASCLAELAEDGWHIAGPVRVEIEVMEQGRPLP